MNKRLAQSFVLCYAYTLTMFLVKVKHQIERNKFCLLQAGSFYSFYNHQRNLLNWRIASHIVV
jgi:hypothetical protein